MHHSFPFVCFGISQKREAMRSAFLQMRRQDFEADTFAIAKLTVADLKQAEEEEAHKIPISNPAVRLLRKHVVATNGRVLGSDHARAAYQGMIWGTCLFLGGASLWVTINPADIHDPIAQIFAGHEIDMVKFCTTMGPDANQRACTIAENPYAAEKYFRFIINTVLKTLFGIKSKGGCVSASTGILGRLAAYYGVVKAQGRGSYTSTYCFGCNMHQIVTRCTLFCSHLIFVNVFALLSKLIFGHTWMGLLKKQSAQRLVTHS